MEMEPVSKHLGDYRIRFNNPFDCGLFVSTYLDKLEMKKLSQE